MTFIIRVPGGSMGVPQAIKMDQARIQQSSYIRY
jgi:hypothetical protein